jgi:hypothetical protein
MIPYFFIFLAISFFIVTILNAKLLQPINKLWMQFGFLLGKIINPLILGIIFFGIFTPIGIIMKLFGRDELNINIEHKHTYWKDRGLGKINLDTFKNQF